MSPTRALLLIALLLFSTNSAAGVLGSEAVAHEIRNALLPPAQLENLPSRTPRAQAREDDLRLFYTQRNHAPAWSDPARLLALADALASLVDDGLDPEHYLQAELRAQAELRVAGERLPPDPAQTACSDLSATRAYLQALHDLSSGRLNPVDAGFIWHFRSDVDSIMAREQRVMLAESGLADIGAAFDRARPATSRYHGLRNAHAALREQAAMADWTAIPAGPSLREGMRDDRVALLRQRLSREDPVTPATVTAVAGPDPFSPGPAGANTSDRADPALAAAPASALSPISGSDPDLYDIELVVRVRAFQHRHNLQVDGIVGPATLAALNASPAQRLDQIKVNLERMRWLAREQEPTHVLVDVAGAAIHYVRDGEIVWTTRAQVGRAARPTPPLKSEITHVTFNPTWTIPPTILRNDKLPEIRRDIDYLAQNNIRVLDHSGRELSPYEVDWDRPGAVMLRQDAGPGNALGQVAIRFPNPFHVYLHDTPNQRLFQRDQRAVSSGCVRVENAMTLVDLLLEEGAGEDKARAYALLNSGRTRNFNLSHPVPVLIAYWTADIDERGEPTYRPDLYGQDEQVLRALSTSFTTDPLHPPAISLGNSSVSTCR